MEKEPQPAKAADPCKPKACAIQKCLERTRYNTTYCQQYFDRLAECCKLHGHRSDACGFADQKSSLIQG